MAPKSKGAKSDLQAAVQTSARIHDGFEFSRSGRPRPKRAALDKALLDLGSDIPMDDELRKFLRTWIVYENSWALEENRTRGGGRRPSKELANGVIVARQLIQFHKATRKEAFFYALEAVYGSKPNKKKVASFEKAYDKKFPHGSPVDGRESILISEEMKCAVRLLNEARSKQ